MRRILFGGGALALIAIAFAGYQAQHAIAHPVTCPGAFFGCPQNGEETTYVTAIWTMVALFALTLMPLIRLGWITSRGWRRLIIAAFVFTVALFPVPGGMIAAIFLSTVAPGYGVLVLLALELAISAILFAFATQWPVAAPVALAPTGTAPMPPSAAS